jgi:hypothetical protein
VISGIKRLEANQKLVVETKNGGANRYKLLCKQILGRLRPLRAIRAMHNHALRELDLHFETLVCTAWPAADHADRLSGPQAATLSNTLGSKNFAAQVALGRNRLCSLARRLRIPADGHTRYGLTVRHTVAVCLV